VVQATKEENNPCGRENIVRSYKVQNKKGDYRTRRS
jgi:hypothetical protein